MIPNLRTALRTVVFLTGVLSIIASGSGGGSSGNSSGGTSGNSSGATNPGTPPPPPLTVAADFNSFVSAITSQYQPALDFFNTNLPTALQPGAWSSSISSVSAAMAFTNNNPNPIQGKYSNYAVADWPTGNANLQFSGSNSGVMAFSSFDTTNQSIANGGAQTFVGIYPGNTQYGPLGAGSGGMLTSILIESIVTDASGTVEYRALQALVGYIIAGTATQQATSEVSGPFASQFQILNPVGTLVTGPIPDGIIGHLFSGEYYEVVLDCYVPQCSTGLALQYSVWLQSST